MVVLLYFSPLFFFFSFPCPPWTSELTLGILEQATLHSGIDLRKAVALPPSEDMNEWLAMHSESAGAGGLVWRMASAARVAAHSCDFGSGVYEGGESYDVWRLQRDAGEMHMVPLSRHCQLWTFSTASISSTAPSATFATARPAPR